MFSVLIGVMAGEIQAFVKAHQAAPVKRVHLGDVYELMKDTNQKNKLEMPTVS